MSDTLSPGRPKTAPGFHHVALRASDFEATVRFYQDGLGFVCAYGWGEGDSRAALLDTGDGNYLEIFAGGKSVPGTEPPEGALLHFALRTADVDGDYARALAAGSAFAGRAEGHHPCRRPSGAGPPGLCQRAGRRSHRVLPE